MIDPQPPIRTERAASAEQERRRLEAAKLAAEAVRRAAEKSQEAET